MKQLTKCRIEQERNGFSLIEIVMVVTIIVILSLISGPLYNGYSTNAKHAEGYALLGTILSAQQTYHSETGTFLDRLKDGWVHNNGLHGTSNSTVLGIDARGNKYYTFFSLGIKSTDGHQFTAYVCAPHMETLGLRYDITGGGATYL
ncbi:MAG: prepilin-type N-terminal cleavage/methylation domain-containing protein [Elusimicrobia bacterium]|nr:prepilin-type N-terminal cleavage/methylation domain-containing protein [Elusimicrobiota bacterium]